MKRQTEYSVVISERAKRMLVSHAGFLGQVSHGKAERLVGSFEKAAQPLEFMTQRCPCFTGVDLSKMFYRYLFLKSGI